MHPWEYHHEPGYPTLERVNDLGCQGWEAVAEMKLGKMAGDTVILIHGLLFKRPAFTVNALLAEAGAQHAVERC